MKSIQAEIMMVLCACLWSTPPSNLTGSRTGLSIMANFFSWLYLSLREWVLTSDQDIECYDNWCKPFSHKSQIYRKLLFEKVRIDLPETFFPDKNKHQTSQNQLPNPTQIFNILWQNNYNLLLILNSWLHKRVLHHFVIEMIQHYFEDYNKTALMQMRGA